MAVIIDMDMPKGCWGCKYMKSYNHKTSKCMLLGKKFDDRLDLLTSRLEDCPLKEVNECKAENLCNSCTNIACEFQSGIVRHKCDFYMPHLEPDNCGNYVVDWNNCHTADAISYAIEHLPSVYPKSENSVLEDIKAEIKEELKDFDTITAIHFEYIDKVIDSHISRKEQTDGYGRNN